MGFRWNPSEAIVASLCSLVTGGRSVRSVALELGIPLSVGYRIAHERGLPLKRKRMITTTQADKISALWRSGFKPMDISRAVGVDPTPVYRIGVELGLWRRSLLPRRAQATRRRCEYLYLHISAFVRKDAAAAMGINRRTALDVDKGVVKGGSGRIPFVPDGPDAHLYKRLMPVLDYVNGRVAVPV